MPIISEEEERKLPSGIALTPFRNPEAKPTEEFSFIDKTVASFRQQNSAVSAASYVFGGQIQLRDDFSYDTFSKIKGTKYEQHWESFLEVDSDPDLEIIQKRIDKEEYDRKVLESGGATAFAMQLAAGVLDSVNFIGGGAWLLRAGKSFRAAVGAKALLKTGTAFAAGSAAFGGASVALSEAALHGTQELRTLDESIHTIGAGAILTGILGPTFAKVGPKLKQKLMSKVDNDLIVDSRDFEPGSMNIRGGFAQSEFADQFTMSAEGVSVKAEEQIDQLLKANTIVGSAASKVSGFLKRLNPELNLAQSKSANARETLQKLAKTSLLMEKHFSGESIISAEALVETFNVNVGKAILDIREIFKAYKERVGKLPEGSLEKPMTYDQFNEAISYAAFKGDKYRISPDKKNILEVKEVTKASKIYRDYLYDPALKHGQADGVDIFPKNAKRKNEDSYFPVMYDPAKVIAYGNELKQVIKNNLPKFLVERVRVLPEKLRVKGLTEAAIDHFDKKIANLNTKLRGYKEKLTKSKAGTKTHTNLQDKILKTHQDIKDLNSELLPKRKKLYNLTEDIQEINKLQNSLVDADSYNNLAEEIYGSIRGNKKGVVSNNNVPLYKGVTKKRILDFIPQEELRPFTLNNAEEVAKRYLRTTIPEIVIRSMFEGDIDLKNAIKLITDDYTILENAARKPLEKIKLQKQRDNDIADIKALVGRLRNTYGKANDPDLLIYTGLQGLRLIVGTARLGGIVLSSIPDLGRLVAIKGLSAVFTEGIKPMIFNRAAYIMSKKEAKLAGAAWEIVLGNSRSMTMNELFDPINSTSKVRRGIDAIADKFSKYSLSNYYEIAKKEFSSVLIQKKNYEDILAFSKGELGSDGIAYLAKQGIGKEDALDIAKMFESKGKLEGEVFIANTTAWGNKRAQRVYRAALNKQISEFATQPGIADRPRWMSGEVGKTLGMFESFNMAATTKILISSMQVADMNTLAALSTQFGLGMMVYAMRETIAGNKISDDPSIWISKGFDNSGIGGIFSSVNNRLAGLTDGYLNASRLIGSPREEYNSDYAKRAMNSFGGPVGGYVTDALEVGNGFIGADPWTWHTTRAGRKLIPFNNIIYLRNLFDKLEEGFNSAFGIKARKKK